MPNTSSLGQDTAPMSPLISTLPQMFHHLLLFLPLILLTFTLVYLLLNLSTKQPRLPLPPSPPKVPILGNLHQLGSLPHQSLHSLSAKYGPIMLLQLGRIPTLFVSSVDLAREIMKEQDHKFASRPSLTNPLKLLYNGRGIAWTPYGEYWRQAKKVSLVHLLNTRRVLSYRTIREEEVALMVDRISASSSLGDPVNLSKDLNKLAEDVISRITLGRCQGDEGWGGTLRELVRVTSCLLGAFHWADYIPWLAWVSAVTGMDSRVKKAFQDADETLERIVETHRRELEEMGGEKSGTFVDILLSLDKEPNGNYPFDKESFKAIIKDMLGGIEATYVVMQGAMAELVRSPETMRKLKQEIRGIVGSRAVVTEEDLIKMDYLKAVIKETLRLNPPEPVIVPRELMEDAEIRGYHIPKNTRVFINVWTIGRDPDVWDSPDRFYPERFAGDGAVDFIGHDFELLPFGAGRRICPGIQFAVQIIELAVANLVHRFDWKLPTGEKDLDLTYQKEINLFLVASACSSN